MAPLLLRAAIMYLNRAGLGKVTGGDSSTWGGASSVL
jgi:hypothetical protein